MADAPGTSFIPQQRNAPKVAPIRRKRFYVFNFIATVVFVVTALLTAGTFFYKDFSGARLIEQKEALAEQRNIFSESDIASVQELNNRILAAEAQLESQVSILKLLTAIEETTPVSIQYKNFSYLRQNSGESVVLLSGVTDDFDSVISQKQSLEDSDILNRSIVADVRYNTNEELDDEDEDETEAFVGEEKKAIGFSLSIVVPASEIPYTIDTPRALESEFEDGGVVVEEVTGELVDAPLDGTDTVLDEEVTAESVDTEVESSNNEEVNL